MIPAMSRPAWAEINSQALISNARLMQDMCSPAKLCAVVKADGYGHGALLVAKVLEDHGVNQFAVANVDEAIELREGGVTSPILCLSEPCDDAIEEALARNVTVTLYSRSAIKATADASKRLVERKVLTDANLRYHLKVDTGMHRVGADPSDAMDLARLGRELGLILGGFWTHMAIADEPPINGRENFTLHQISIFESLKSQLLADGFEPEFHVANSAACYNFPESRYDMVRSGIAIYGCSPSSNMHIPGLRQAISLKAKVSFTRKVGPGVRPSYGRRRPTQGKTTLLATVPLGYADGVPRALFEAGAQVLIGGKRRELAGMVTMDQVIVDCGSDLDVSIGDEVVFLGSQGSHHVGIDEWSRLLGTIDYEVITQIGFRVPRVLKADVDNFVDNDVRNVTR